MRRWQEFGYTDLTEQNETAHGNVSSQWDLFAMDQTKNNRVKIQKGEKEKCLSTY